MAKTYMIKITIDEEQTGQCFSDLTATLDQNDYDWELMEEYGD